MAKKSTFKSKLKDILAGIGEGIDTVAARGESGTIKENREISEAKAKKADKTRKKLLKKRKERKEKEEKKEMKKKKYPFGLGSEETTGGEYGEGWGGSPD